MNLIEQVPFQEGNFCRLYTLKENELLGELQILILADSLDSSEGGDRPCLSVKTQYKGAILTGNQFFSDTEEGEAARDKMLALLDGDRATKLLQKIEFIRFLELLAEEKAA